MTDKKDDRSAPAGPGKGAERGSADTPASKRPFATIDLKAVEVPPVSEQSAAVAPKAAATGQAEAAQKVAAAAAAAVSQRPAGASASGIPVTGARTVAERSDTSSAGRADASKGKTGDAASPRQPSGAEAMAVPPPATAVRGGSGLGRFASHALAGLVGGALALIAAPHIAPQLTPMLSELGLPTPPVPPLAPDVALRIAALERGAAARPVIDPSADPARILTLAEANRKSLDELAAALATVRTEQSKTAELATGIETRLTREPPIADAAERLVRLEQQLTALANLARTEPTGGGRIPQLAQLTGRIDDMDTALKTRTAALRKEVLQEVDTRLVPTTEASETARSGTQRIDRDVIALKSETNRIATGLDQVKTSADRLALALKTTQDETAGMAARLDGFRRDVEGRLTATAKPADVAKIFDPLASQVATLEKSLIGVVRSETERQATAERIVLSLELGNLKRAMERGTPYAQELAEVKKVAGSRVDLSPLEPFRNEGVPTLAELTRGFRPVANAILDAEREKTDGSVVDRLMSGAKTFVRVRKTAHAAGDASPEALVARIEGALKAGRLGDALAEAKTLTVKPPAATEWLAKVEARQAVDVALAAMDGALKSSLGAGAVEPPAAQKKAAP